VALENAQHVWVHDYQAVYEAAGLKCATFRCRKRSMAAAETLHAAKQFTPGWPASNGRQGKRKRRQKIPRPAPMPHSGGSYRFRGAYMGAPVATRDSRNRRDRSCGQHLILVNMINGAANKSADPAGASCRFWTRGPILGAPEDDETAIRELERLRRPAPTISSLRGPPFGGSSTTAACVSPASGSLPVFWRTNGWPFSA